MISKEIVHNSHIVSDGRKGLAELWIITNLFPSSWGEKNSQKCHCQWRLTHILLFYVLLIPWIFRGQVWYCTDFVWAQVNFLHNSLYNAVFWVCDQKRPVQLFQAALSARKLQQGDGKISKGNSCSSERCWRTICTRCGPVGGVQRRSQKPSQG